MHCIADVAFIQKEPSFQSFLPGEIMYHKLVFGTKQFLLSLVLFRLVCWDEYSRDILWSLMGWLTPIINLMCLGSDD